MSEQDVYLNSLWPEQLTVRGTKQAGRKGFHAWASLSEYTLFTSGLEHQGFLWGGGSCEHEEHRGALNMTGDCLVALPDHYQEDCQYRGAQSIKPNRKPSPNSRQSQAPSKIRFWTWPAISLLQSSLFTYLSLFAEMDGRCHINVVACLEAFQCSNLGIHFSSPPHSPHLPCFGSHHPAVLETWVGLLSTTSPDYVLRGHSEWVTSKPKPPEDL